MTEKFAYGFGAMASGTDCYVAGTESELEDEDVEHGIIFESALGKWSAWSVGFRVAALAYAAATATMFVVGQNGGVEVTTATSAWDESVDPTVEGPTSVRPLNAACAIGQHVYVAGMRRQVYRRAVDAPSWSRFDDSCFIDPPTTNIRGFNAIHGEAEVEIYAVGLQGEIWCCAAGSWKQIDSPTNTSLYQVHQLHSGEVLVGGGLGLLLRGDRSGFEPVVHDLSAASITGIAEFAGRVLVSDESGGLFEYARGMLLPATDIARSDEGGGQLDANNRALIYVRSDSVLLFDGNKWRDATPPDEA